MSDIQKLLTELQALQAEVTLDGRHCYRRAKKVVPGVTSVIKVLDAPALDAWKVRVQVEGTARTAYLETPWENESEDEYVNRLVARAKGEFEHERLANEAADVGKQVHALIEHAIKTDLGVEIAYPEVTEEALFTFAGWRDWAKAVDLKPLMAEARICGVSFDHNGGLYCGTFDLLALVQGEPAVLDWKPKPHIYPERRLQLAAYRGALHESGWPTLGGYVVSLPRDGGEIEMVSVPFRHEDLRAFEHCLEIYQWLKAVQKAERAEAAA